MLCAFVILIKCLIKCKNIKKNNISLINKCNNLKKYKYLALFLLQF